MHSSTPSHPDPFNLKKQKDHFWRDPLFLAAFALVFIYLVWIATRPQGVFWSMDEGGKFIYLQNVIQTWHPGGALVYPGRSIDSALKFVPLYYFARVNDQIYSWWPVGFPLLTLIPYQLLGWLGLFLIPAISGSLTSLFAGLSVRVLLPQSRWLPLAAVILVGLATPVAFYSTMYWEHTSATAGLMGALYFLLLGFERDDWRSFLLASFCASIGTFMRSEIGLFAFGFGLVILILNWRKAFIYGSGFVISALPWLALNLRWMGHPISRQVEQIFTENPLFKGMSSSQLLFFPQLLFNSGINVAYKLPNWVLFAGTAAVVIGILAAFFKRTYLIFPVATLIVTGISAGVLFSPEGYWSVHGFVLISPIILFCVWATTGRKNPFTALCFVSIVVFFAGYIARAWNSAGGLQWGPRYLLGLYPLLIVASLVGLASKWNCFTPLFKRGILAIFLFTALVSTGFEIRGLLSSRIALQYYDQTRGAVRDLSPMPVISNCVFMPMVIPEQYWTGTVFSINEYKLDYFLEEARAAGIQKYAYLQMDMCSLATLDKIAVMRAQNPTGITVEVRSIP
jgi:hypothetical protein